MVARLGAFLSVLPSRNSVSYSPSLGTSRLISLALIEYLVAVPEGAQEGPNQVLGDGASCQGYAAMILLMAVLHFGFARAAGKGVEMVVDAADTAEALGGSWGFRSHRGGTAGNIPS